MTTLYEVLGVSPEADQVVITAAYRAMMRKHHPDVTADPRSQALARSVTAAYEALSSAERRAAYDQRLREERRAAGAAAGGEGQGFGTRPAAHDRPDASTPGQAQWRPPPGAAPSRGGSLTRTARRAAGPLSAALAALILLATGVYGFRALAASGFSPGRAIAAAAARGDGAPSGRPAGCAAPLSRLLRLPAELSGSFGDLGQILRAQPAAEPAEGGVKIIRIAPPDPCAASAKEGRERMGQALGDQRRRTAARARRGRSARAESALDIATEQAGRGARRPPP